MSFIKKLITGSLLSIVALAGLASLVSAPAYAATPKANVPSSNVSNDVICGGTGAAGTNCAVTGGTTFDGGVGGIVGILLSIARVVVYIVGALAVLFLVYGGVMYLTAGGDDGKVKSARAIITNAIIGLVIAIVAFSIVTIVTNLVSGTLIGS
jgi:hypothetical protein